jgi:hypothetical protein
VLRALARRVRALQAETAEHEHAILAIVRSWRPDLPDQPGVGPINAARVLTAWSHPGRCRNDAAFAMIAGVARDPGLLGQDRAIPAQLERGPPGQPRPAQYRPGQTALLCHARWGW